MSDSRAPSNQNTQGFAQPNPSSQQEQHGSTQDNAQDHDTPMSGEYEDSDPDESDDELEERIRKSVKRQAKIAQNKCFSFIDEKHWQYVDIIASKLGSSSEAGKTLQQIFKLEDEEKAKAFQEKYQDQIASITQAVQNQQEKDFNDALKFLQDQDLFGDDAWLRERNWLRPDELHELHGDSKNIQQTFGYIAKTLRCYLPLHQQFFSHPVGRIQPHDEQRDVLRDTAGVPRLPYLQHAREKLHAFVSSAEKENQSQGVFWSDRPIGITDELWQTQMKELLDQKRVELQKQQHEALGRLPSDQQAAAFRRKAERLKQEEKRREEQEEGVKDLEVRIDALKKDRSEVHSRLEVVPEGVQAAQRELIPYIQYWWAHDENELDNQRFTRANVRIRAATEETRFLLTYTELLPAIKTFRTFLSQSEGTAVGSSNSGQPSRSLSDLMGDAISLTNLLRRVGLDWKTVVTKDIHERFFRLLYSNNDESLKQTQQNFEQSWLDIHAKQKGVLESAKPLAETYRIIRESLSMPLEDALRVLIEQYSTLNVSLKSTNDLLAIPSADHSIPVAELQAALRNRDSKENQDYCLAVFLYKITLLQIPGYDVMKEVLKVSLTKEQETEIRRQVLGFAITSLPGDIEAHSLYPTMSSTSLASKYASCSVQATEMWGGATAGRRFYINRYGPETSPIHRIERQPVAGHSWKHVSLPLPFQVGCEDNKFGHIKKYGAEHVSGIAGVAWSEDIDMTPYPSAVEYLNPIYHELSSEHYVAGYKTTYVLVKWDRFLLSRTLASAQVVFEYRWETRTDLRKRWHGADRKIYEFAKQRQEEFEAWQEGRPIREVSPQSPLQPARKQVSRSGRSLTPAQTQRIGSLSASYRQTPSPMPQQRRRDRASESPDRSLFKDQITLRVHESDSAYGSRSGSEETDVAGESVRASVEDAEDVEEVWGGLQRKYRNDPQKQRDAMDVIFRTQDWMSILKQSFTSLQVDDTPRRTDIDVR